MSRRRLRLRELLPKPYVAQVPEDDRYTPPPPDPAEDGPRESYLKPPERGLGILTMGEAMLAYAASHADALTAWRGLFPRSSEVLDGVHQSEAAVVPLGQPYMLEGEEADNGR